MNDQINQFTRKNVTALQAEAAALLAPLAAKYGITIQPAGGSLDDARVMLKFSFEVTSEDGLRAEFAKNAPLFHCKAEDYGRAATINGKEVTLLGFALSRSKRPIKCKDRSGKVWIYTVDVLHRYFHTGRAPAPLASLAHFSSAISA